MDAPINLDELKQLKVQLKNSLDEDKRYWRVNEVKCDAITTAKTYEEFSDRVAAAHLRPMEKSDRIRLGECKTVWNNVAGKNKSEERN